MLFEQGAGVADGTLDLPEGVAAVKGQFRVSSFKFRVRARFLRPSRSLGGRNDKGFTEYWQLTTDYCIQRADLRQSSEFVFAEFGNAAGDVVNGCEGSTLAFADQGLACFFAQAADVAQAHAEGDYLVFFGGFRIFSTGLV